MSQLVFVYGTLRPHCRAAAKLEHAEHIESATLFGRLYDFGWYPGLVLDPLAGEVKGDIFSVPEMCLPILDSYEGCSVSDPEPHEYKRLLTTVRGESGALCEAWVWEYQQNLKNRPEIPCGDWIAYCKALGKEA